MVSIIIGHYLWIQKNPTGSLQLFFKAVVTGTMYSSLGSVDLRPSLSVLQADDSGSLVIYFRLITLKAAETITAADSLVRERFSSSPVITVNSCQWLLTFLCRSCGLGQT